MTTKLLDFETEGSEIRPADGQRSGPARRLLFIIDQLCAYGGAERMLLEIARRIPEMRYEVGILTFELDPLIPEFRDSTISIEVLRLGKTISLHGAKAAFRLNQLLRRKRVQGVHTFFETSDLWAAPVARLSGCRVLVSSRRDMGILRTSFHRRAYPFVDPLFSRILPVSESVRGCVMKSPRLRSERVETLYNGVDISVVDRARRQKDVSSMPGISFSGPLIVTLANIRRVKGLDVLIEAFSSVASSIPEARLVIAGKVLEPETMCALQVQVSALGLVDRVLFPGPLTNPFPLLDQADLFVLPSRSEGFSNALLEAMACGLPIVATGVGGNAEAVLDRRTGFIVAPEQPREMAQRMQELLSNRPLARLFGQQARVRVIQQFSMESMMERLLSIYDRCFEEGLRA
jgi:glycosyltransferase involved in cell wall biosynthesis